jgi:nitroimidazol reductase NimA-like FMN-containing flavoprotein (pyridoxamine 5'-phosphate oxidase superfamily)
MKDHIVAKPQSKIVSNWRQSHMRRQDRQLKNKAEIVEILEKGKFVVLALCQGNEPYIVTLSYGYDPLQNCLYLHCANEGLKLDFIRNNPAVCGTIIIDKGYIENECGHEYETIVLRGQVVFLETVAEKRCGIETILRHLEVNPRPIMEKTLKTDDAYKTVTVLKLVIAEMTGKKGR